MENEKKKRQKKKKNKQGKTGASAGVGESTSDNNNHANQSLNSDNSDVPKRGPQQSVVDSDRESISGAETSRSTQAEKSYWFKREASLEQKIKELQEQLDMHVQREADLEKNISQSQEERNLWHHKETEFETIISQLQTEKHSWLQKEAGFEEKLNRLIEETSTLRSTGMLEEKCIQIEAEKIDVAQREGDMKIEVGAMRDDCSVQNAAAETIASLSKDNAKLRAQVVELETSINNTSHQNQRLTEQVSDLQSKIQDLLNSHGTVYQDMNSQLESAQALVAKLLSENEKLVEKVNDLKSELDQKTAATHSYSHFKPNDPFVKNPKAVDTDETSASETDPISSSAETVDTVSNADPLSGSTDGMPSDKLVNHMTSDGYDLNQISRVSMESGEIVQISLNENDIPAATSATSVPNDPVPLTDAPLIGAPFRFISFVARYVSGADLVQK